MLKSLVGKKTKKEKIMAEYRRKLQTLHGSQFTVHSLPADKAGSQYKLPEKPEEVTLKPSNNSIATVNSVYSEPKTDYSYVISDLKRIAILTALAICAQLVLWYRLGRG